MACPPNWFRRADTSRIPKASFFWEANLANSAEEMTGADTPRSMASSTVQRPSPESATTPSILSKPDSGRRARSASSRSQLRTTDP